MGIGVQYGLEEAQKWPRCFHVGCKVVYCGQSEELRVAVYSQSEFTLIGGQRMAQTRRVGKHNERAYLLSAPRFSPYRSWQDHGDRSLPPLPPSPFPPPPPHYPPLPEPHPH